MPKHTQRKLYESADLAAEAEQAFQSADPNIVNTTMTARTLEIDGAIWLYVTHEGEGVTGNEPLLPGYEPDA